MIAANSVKAVIWLRPQSNACQFVAVEDPIGGALGS